MNTLAYIKLNRVIGEEIEQGKRNTWLFVRVNEDDNSAEAIALMRLFSSVCESEGFHIIGESVFIGNEIGAEHFLKSFITRIPFVDCIVVPDIRTITSNPRNAFEVVDKLQNEGVDLLTMMDDRFSKATSTISVLRAYRQCNKTCKCE